MQIRPTLPFLLITAAPCARVTLSISPEGGWTGPPPLIVSPP